MSYIINGNSYCLVNLNQPKLTNENKIRFWNLTYFKVCKCVCMYVLLKLNKIIVQL